MSNEQHCPTCETEYVAGIAACADCGGPLSPGPLEHMAAAAPPPPPDGGAQAADFDAVLATLPGLQAHHAMQALLMENVPCFLECQGLAKTYQPGSASTGPLAVNLPVTVHVRSADLESAREIVTSIDEEDLIGEQWGDAVEATTVEGGNDDAAVAAGDGTALDADTALQPERTSMVTAVVVVAVVLGLLFLFGR
jgi:hypothetical protein